METSKMQVKIESEYGRLHRVVVHAGNTMIAPKELKRLLKKHDSLQLMEEAKYHPESGIWNRGALCSQLAGFHDVLRDRGVELIYAQNVSDAWTQFFTRDAGFVVGDTFYFGVFRDQIRRLEKQGIVFLKNYFERTVELTNPSIEGGDVFVHGNKVFVGIGRQTTNAAFKELQDHVESRGFCCIPVECDESVLHLDCRFNIVGVNTAMMLPEGISPRGIKTLERHFNLIKIADKTSKKTLVTNYFIISPEEVVVDERNGQVAHILQDAGYKVVLIPFTEPTKIWGGLRCATCPLVRE